ncbi:MAG: adenosylcobinamide-GDP ribazoletransferase [bacterium]|nr:adenosylcobinamide-GDP ribazoletransferase [bacterium]
MRQFITALGFLTLFPFPARSDFDAKDLGRSMALFPLVGLLLGGILFFINYALSPYLPDRLVNIIIIASLVLLTGGLHLDGFMDTLDGIGGGNNREKILKIMRDSRVGAFGAMGIVFLVLIKWESLNSLGEEVKGMALILMPVISRYGMALLTHIAPYARDEGLGRPFVEGLTLKRVGIALSLTLVISFIAAGMTGIIILLIVTALGLLWSRWFIKKIGGITGDVIGAFNEVTELVALMLFAFFI